MPIRPMILEDIPRLVYIPIAKCAHRSIMKGLRDAKIPTRTVDWDELPDLPRVIMIRDPMDRAVSAYSMFKEQGDIDISFDACMSQWFKGHKPARTIGYDDMHFNTQWHEMKGLDGYHRSAIVRWDFDELAERLGLPGNDFQQIGKSVKPRDCLLTLDTRDKFNRYYKQDYELWNG